MRKSTRGNQDPGWSQGSTQLESNYCKASPLPLRCYSNEGDVSFEMLAIKESYRYEYLGDCTQPVWYKNFERTIYSFFSSYAMKHFPVLKGGFSSGKSTVVHEVARLLGQNLVSEDHYLLDRLQYSRIGIRTSQHKKPQNLNILNCSCLVEPRVLVRGCVLTLWTD